MRSLSRRNFCLGMVGAAATLAGSTALGRIAMAQPQKGAPSGGKRFPDVGTLLIPMQDDRLALFRPHDRRTRMVELPKTVPHSVIVLPSSGGGIAYVLGRRNVAAVDISSAKVIGNLQPDQGRLFSGHGCFTADGKSLVLSSRSVGYASTGEIGVYDLGSQKKTGGFPTTCRNPISIALAQGGSTLIVGHRGVRGSQGEALWPAELGYHDFKSGRLIKKMVPRDPFWGPSHFDLNKEEEIAISTQHFFELDGESESGAYSEQFSFPTPLLVGDRSGESWDYLMPNELKLRMKLGHSIRVDRSRNRFFVVHESGNLVSLWDMAAKKPISHVSIPRPAGIEISKDGLHYIVVTRDCDVYLLSPENLSTTHLARNTKLRPDKEGPDHVALA